MQNSEKNAVPTKKSNLHLTASQKQAHFNLWRYIGACLRMRASEHNGVQQIVQQRRLLSLNFLVGIRAVVALAVGDGALKSIGEVAAGA